MQIDQRIIGRQKLEKKPANKCSGNKKNNTGLVWQRQGGTEASTSCVNNSLIVVNSLSLSVNLCNAATCSNKWRAEPNGGTVHAADASLHGDGDGLKEKWRFMVLSCIDTVEVILSDWWIYKGEL